jgi:hypothetical protein
MKKQYFLILLFSIFTLNVASQDSRKKIIDYINIEIYLDNGFAGESLTLIQEKKKYFIVRKIFGSGVPKLGTFKYLVKFNSDWQIDFWEIIHSESSVKLEKPQNEKFSISIEEEDGASVYLNNLKLSTEVK